MDRATFTSLAAALAMLLTAPSTTMAQDERGTSAENRFLVTGYGFASYTDTDTSESFNFGFSPIFLYRVGDSILFEAELEFEIEDDEVETAVEYAQIDWLVDDRLTVVGGKYLTPFGSFIEKLHPAWINKLPTAPLPYRHGASLVPFGQTGMQLRGGIPLGDGHRRVTYSFFVSNGFRQALHGHGEEGEEGEEGHDEEGEEEHDEEGEEGHDEEGEDDHDDESELIFLDGSSANGNDELAVGGRVAVFPARGFEIGVSYMSGSYDELGQLDASMRGLDVAYHHDLFDLRAEWLETDTERGLDHDGARLADQEIDSWYVQPSLRLSVIPVYAFNKLELVGRLAKLDWGAGDEDQLSIGLNYYFTSSSILRVAWERRERSGEPSDDAVDVKFAVGF